ncbi:MAG TPA: ribonuclease HII [Limnobacter sp.]|nr:ribonuclease HII [Limnobacter sp.]
MLELRALAAQAEPWPALWAYAKHHGLHVIGVDEAGRGPLFGPVVAGAAMLHPEHPIEGLACSKTLSPKRREALYGQIQQRAQAHAVAQASVAEIDSLNILKASLLAMHRAVDAVMQQTGLTPAQCLVVVDGNKLPAWSYRSVAVVKGDSKVPAVSAGSILAKVWRDHWCHAQAQIFPQYELHLHMGYPTARHMDLLRQHGASALHRRSFRPVREVLELGQQGLFE